MKTLEEFNCEIAEYLLTLKNKNGNDIAPISTRDKWKKVLNDIVLVLISKGHDTPSENDYQEYRASRKISDDTFKRYKKQIELFFSWCKERRHEIMPDEAIIEPETLTASEPVNEPANDDEPVNVDALDATPVEPEPEHKTSNAGRKRFDTQNGEKRSEKLMLYLTPTVIADVRDWCRLKNLSAVNYITGLIMEDLKSKQDKLNFFRQLSDDA